MARKLRFNKTNENSKSKKDGIERAQFAESRRQFCANGILGAFQTVEDSAPAENEETGCFFPKPCAEATSENQKTAAHSKLSLPLADHIALSGAESKSP